MDRPEHERLALPTLILYGTQHILTMYAARSPHRSSSEVLPGCRPPTRLGAATAGIFVSGLATLLQTLGPRPFGARPPIVQGISFAGVSTMVAIAEDGGLRPVL